MALEKEVVYWQCVAYLWKKPASIHARALQVEVILCVCCLHAIRELVEVVVVHYSSTKGDREAWGRNFARLKLVKGGGPLKLDGKLVEETDNRLHDEMCHSLRDRR